MRRGVANRAAERFEDRTAFGRRDVQSPKSGQPLRAQHIAAAPFRLGPGPDDLGRLAAAQFEDQPGGDFETGADKRRVDAALEAVARVADDFEAAAGCGGTDRVEQRCLDINFGGRVGNAGRLAADHAAEALHAVVVGDRGDFGVEFIFAAVQRQEPLALPREAHDEIALELLRVEDVQRPVQIEGQKIRDIDERRDRPETDRFEPGPEPARARAVSEVANMSAEKHRAGGQILDADTDRRAEAALDRGRVERLEPAQPRRREVARDATDTEAIGAVRRHLEVNDRIVETQQARVGRPDRRSLG